MDIAALEAMLARGTDNALLRYGLGRACLEAGRSEEGIAHLAAAVAQDSGYSAAWKSYGRALAEAGRDGEAIEVYRRGIEAAQSNGDVQAAREMQVFKRRLEKGSQGHAPM